MVGRSYLRLRLIDNRHATTMTTFRYGGGYGWVLERCWSKDGGRPSCPNTHIYTNTQELKTADEAFVIYRVPQEHVGFR